MSDPRFLQDGFDKRLSHLVEECGEVLEPIGRVLAAAGKTQRWGPHSVNPLIPAADQVQNIDWLRRELADLRQSIDRLDAAIAEEFPASTTDIHGEAPDKRQLVTSVLLRQGKAKNILRDCARQFLFYEQSHLAKGTPDAAEKAAVNRKFARKCEDAIALVSGVKS